MTRTRAACRLAMVAACVMASAAGASAQERPASPRYVGRPVIEVLQELNRRGLRIVFSTVLVTPTLRVATEPAGPLPRDILDQVLRPHGLEAQRRANGVLVVARTPRPQPGPRPAPVRPGTLRGRVVDASTEQPLADVLVVVQGPERRTTTDAEGRFALEGLDVGDHQVYVSLVGYVLARTEVIVPADGGVEILVPLTSGAGAYTEQLTVIAESQAHASPAPAQFTIRSAELQELRGVLAEDPLRALQTMPGAATGDDFRSEFSVRGSAFRQMGFALDGVPAPWLVHGVQAVEDTGTIAMINADGLEQVTLTAGAGPQPYGNRSGAWVDTRMREGSRDVLRWTGSLSGTGASVVAEGPIGRSRRGAWLVSARQSYIDWLIARLDRENPTTFGFTDAQSKIVFDAGPRHQLQFTTVLGRSRLDERDDTSGPNSTRVGRSGTGLFIGAWRATVGSALVLTQRTALASLRYRNSNPYDQDLANGRAWSWTYRSEATYAPRQWMTLEGGLFIDREWATFHSQQYGSAGAGTPTLRSQSTVGRNRWRQGSLVRARITPWSAVTVDAGLRVDRERVFNQTTTSPWLVARWTPRPRWTVSAGAGQARQLPDLSQLPTGDAFQPLVAERARYLDVSAAYRVSPAAEVQVSAFNRREFGTLRFDALAPRLVDGVPVVPFASGRWANALTVSAHGVELLVRRSAPQGLTGWASYAYGRTQNTETGTGTRYWGDFDQRHLLNVYAAYRFSSRTSASARLRVGSNMPVLGYIAEQDNQLVLASTRNDLRLPTYARLDLRVNRTYHFTKRRLTLFAEVLNVLDRENVGPTDGTVRTNGTVTGFVETLFPVLPSVGLRVEF